jgi:RNA polymerase sigma-70 factor (ECF subfamily)
MMHTAIPGTLSPRLAVEVAQKHGEFQSEALPHINTLYNYALRMTSNADNAQDLVQETYLKAYRFWEMYEKGTNVRAWLFRIMKNSYINRYRKELKEPNTVDYHDIENFYNTIRYQSSDPNDLQEKIYGGLLEDDVARAIESLPEEFRTVVILCDLEGLSYEEIAEFVDCPIGTVRSRLHRGRRLLRGKLFAYAKHRRYITGGEEEEESPLHSEIAMA